jgi:transcriptional regulator with XRE-family HTH domain
MDILRRLGENVRQSRTQKGWSQEELAHRSGLHRTYISGIERGRRNPTVLILQQMADALGTEAPELLRGDAA